MAFKQVSGVWEAGIRRIITRISLYCQKRELPPAEMSRTYVEVGRLRTHLKSQHSYSEMGHGDSRIPGSSQASSIYSNILDDKDLVPNKVEDVG